MGCDIHLYVEVRKDGKWTHHDWREQYRKGFHEDGSPQMDHRKLFKNPLYVGRSYDLFAILADVRNGSGFAGVDTGDGFVPIADPRGLPEDVTEAVAAESSEWNGDGHSHSWFTVAELDAYDWHGPSTKHRGWVDAEGYRQWKEKGKPESWSGGVSGSEVRHLTNMAMARALTEGSSTKQAYTLVEWTESYAASVSHFLERTMPALRLLGTPDDVRIVFWFDN